MWTPRRHPPPALLETAEVVWGSGGVRLTRRSARPQDGRSTWMAVPGVGAPRWLLPAAAPLTAAAVEVDDGRTARRAAGRALAVAHRTGVVRRLPVRRLLVTEPDDGSLVRAVRELAGGDVDVAIRLGSWEHARSLVVRLFAPDGTTTAFGKVGIDPLGNAAVRAEAAALTRVADLRLGQVVTSDVVGRGVWRGLEMVLVSPLSPPAGARTGGLPATAMRELASSGAARTAPLADSAWWDRLRSRIDAVADPAVGRRLARHLADLQRAGGRTALPLGPCHGDWTAWNMARAGSRVLLWDWEHFGEDVPVGFDHVHFLAQDLRVRTGTGPTAETTWLARAHDVLHQHVGLDPVRRDLVLAAYLLDVNVRFVLDRQGTPQAGAARAGWGLDLLRRQVRDLPPAPA